MTIEKGEKLGQAAGGPSSDLPLDDASQLLKTSPNVSQDDEAILCPHTAITLMDHLLWCLL